MRTLENGDDIECQLLVEPDPHVPVRRVPQRWQHVKWTDAGFQVVDRRWKNINMQSRRRETGQKKEWERRDLNTQSSGHKLKMFQTVDPGRRPMGGDRSSRGGTTGTLVGIESLQSVQTKEGPASKRGTEYEVERIPNLREKQFLGVTTEGVSRKIVAQVCVVNKPLLSVK